MRWLNARAQTFGLVLEVVGSISAHAMIALWWTKTVCVGFFGVLLFHPTFFILIITHPA